MVEEKQEEKKPNNMSRVFAIISAVAGVYSFLQGGMRGRSAGWEEMAIYTIPAVIAGVISLAIDRSFLRMALGGIILGLIGFYSGS